LHFFIFKISMWEVNKILFQKCGLSLGNRSKCQFFHNERNRGDGRKTFFGTFLVFGLNKQTKCEGNSSKVVFLAILKIQSSITYNQEYKLVRMNPNFLRCSKQYAYNINC